MTCKNCIHFEMCLKKCGKSKAFAETVDEEYFSHADKCDYFKDKSRYIELPCKVGTTLYFLYNSPYADKPDLTPRIYKTTDWHFEVDKTGIVINTDDIHSFNKVYDYYLGKTVFLTREEAERALKEAQG